MTGKISRQELNNSLNTEINKIDTLQTDFTAHKEDYAQFKTDTEKELANYNEYSSVKDANGIFTVVEYKRSDSTVYMKSTLSNADANGNYQTNTWEYFDIDGVTLLKTLTWTITYDVDGNIVSKVVI